MAVSLKIGICDLPAEFLADAFEFFGFRDPAGTVAPLGLESFLDSGHDLGILVESYVRFDAFHPLYILYRYQYTLLQRHVSVTESHFTF